MHLPYTFHQICTVQALEEIGQILVHEGTQQQCVQMCVCISHIHNYTEKNSRRLSSWIYVHVHVCTCISVTNFSSVVIPKLHVTIFELKSGEQYVGSTTVHVYTSR